MEEDLTGQTKEPALVSYTEAVHSMSDIIRALKSRISGWRLESKTKLEKPSSSKVVEKRCHSGRIRCLLIFNMVISSLFSTIHKLILCAYILKRNLSKNFSTQCLKKSSSRL